MEPSDSERTLPSAPAPQCFEQAITPEEMSASEVSLAIDPTDPRHVVAAANSAGGFGVYTSRNGGETWNAELLQPTDVFGLAGSRFFGLSDPAVAFAPDGTLHVAGLAYIPGSAVFVASRSAPDAPWQGHIVWESEVAATFNDKEWLAVHPETGTLIVAWQREPLLDSLRSVEQASGGAADLDIGQIVVSRSTDAGATWSLPAVVSTSLHNNGTQVAVTRDGRFHLLWVDYEQPALVHAVSQDDGRTWSAPARLSDLVIVGAFPDFSRMHTLPALTAVGDGLVAVWHDGRFDAADVLTATYDGTAWSMPERVPDDEIGSGRIQFYPWAAGDANGTLHVSYYSGDAAGNFTYRYIARSNRTWTPAVDLSQPFPIFAVDGKESADIGDYTALAAAGGALHAAWAQPFETRSHVHSARPCA